MFATRQLIKQVKDSLANLKKNLAYNFLLSFGQVLLPIASIPYVTRVLSPEGIGRVSFMDSLTMYFVAIAEFGIVVYGIREVARTRNDRLALRKLVSELVTLHCITSICTLFLYAITVSILWHRIGDIRLVYFSISFLFINFFACEWYYWGMEEFKYIAIRSLITRLLGLVSMFLLIQAPEDYYIYYAIIVLSATANMLSNNFILFRKLGISFKGINWKRHLKYTWVTYLISLFYSITLLLDSVLVGLVCLPAVVGLYALSIKVVRVGSVILTDMFLVLYPRTVSLLKEANTAAVQATVLKSVQLIIILAVPICSGLFLLADPFISIFLGEEFHSIGSNLKILAILPFIKTFSLFLSKQVLIAHDQEKLYLKSLIAGSIAFVLLTLVFSYYLKDAGACYAIVMAEIIILLINYYYVKKTVSALRIFDWKVFGQCLAITFLFYPVVLLFGYVTDNTLFYLLGSIAICAGLYFFILVFILRNGLLYSLYRQGRDSIFMKH